MKGTEFISPMNAMQLYVYNIWKFEFVMRYLFICPRLLESHKKLQHINNNLEEKLLAVVSFKWLTDTIYLLFKLMNLNEI